MKQLSEETRKKISENRRGKGSSLKGKSLSEGHRQKIGEGRRGKSSTLKGKHRVGDHTKHYVESRKKNGKSWHSDETRKKISEGKRKPNPFRCCSKEEVLEAIKTSSTLMEMMRKLLSEPIKDNYTEFFKIHCFEKGIILPLKERVEYSINNPNLFLRNSVRDASGLKAVLLENNLIKNQCNVCGLLPVWNGKPLILNLDHKDGDKYNNERENLQLVCWNCDSQSQFFVGRNKGRYRDISSTGKLSDSKSELDSSNLSVPAI